MRLFERGIAYLYAGAAPLCATLLLSAGMAAGAAAADDKTYVMKITLATQNDNLHQFARNYSAALERDFDGPAQSRDLSRQSVGLDFAADRRHPVRRDPSRGAAARILRRRR